jgi:hypothetical protein
MIKREDVVTLLLQSFGDEREWERRFIAVLAFAFGEVDGTAV